jgi:hypothetical protein
VTLSDLDLEAGLRQQRTRADEIPPAPFDLAQRVRERSREQRRRRVALTAAGVAAALVVVGLPALTSGLIGEGIRGESAAPSSAPRRTLLPSNLDVPTRGSLAGDEDWLAGIRALSWLSKDMPAPPPEIEFPDPALEDRTVAFAGDVPGGRVALVLARTGSGTLVRAWFTGPRDAQPRDMVLASRPWGAPREDPLALWVAPDPASDRAVLVVVSRPGDQVEVLTGRDVAASGETSELWEPLLLEDGAGAMTLGSALASPSSPELRIRRTGEQRTVVPEFRFSDAVIEAALAPVAVADPRGLLARVDGEALQWAVQALVAHYGLPADRLDPTLLAGGPVGGSGTSTVLVGVTFPSGATTVHLLTHQGDRNAPEGASSIGMLTDPAPAGTALLDRVVAVPLGDTITVSAPAAGVLAEVYLKDGTLLTTMPLVEGAGSAPLPPPAAQRVRILDADGIVVAEAPLTGRGG